MPLSNSHILGQWLAQFVYLCFFVFGILGFAVGVGLIVSSHRTLRFMGVMNRWVSFRRETKWIAVPRDFRSIVERYRLWFGAVFVAAGGFSIYRLTTAFDAAGIGQLLGKRVPGYVALFTGIATSVQWVLLAGSALAVVIGVMLCFFPNALSALEARANRWYSFRRFSLGGDTMHLSPDQWVEAYPRIAGWIVAVATLAITVDSGIRLFTRL